MVTLSPLTSEAGFRFPAQPHVGKLVVACRYSVESNIKPQINKFLCRSHGVSVVTHLPPTSEVSSSNPRPYVGNLVVAYRWSAVYSTEP